MKWEKIGQWGCPLPGCSGIVGPQVMMPLLRNALRVTSYDSRSALFAEIPSNPLLRTPDLHRLRALADKYDIPIILDATVDNFANLDVRGYADILVTSLSKLFSGAMNAMGGR